MDLLKVSLDDKFILDEGRIYLTGIQALVRLLLMQQRLDQQRGLNTGGFVSGYRGSPLGAFDLNLWRAEKYLQNKGIHFSPGLNEDLGATAIWGAQQTNLFRDATVDGVYAMWYGKGPGVDRSGDALKHANAAGTSKYGGVLALCGDDHACKSSTMPHQSEYALIHALMPVMAPSSVQDILDLGLYGWALSRYSGCWVGFKVVSDTVDTSASVYADPNRINIVTPDDFFLPPSGLNIRWPDVPLEQEKRLIDFKLPSVKAFTRVNDINKLILPSKKARIGIVTAGKVYLDTRQALEDLGISEGKANQMGIRLLKIGVTWPLEEEIIRKFAEGLEEIIVVEEKRSLLEVQIKDILYHMPADQRPRVVGKVDENGKPLFHENYELDDLEIALVLIDRFKQFEDIKIEAKHLADLRARHRMLESKDISLQRIPYYCSGCPHNTSTHVPEDSRALGGIGCHYMATWIDDKTKTFTQMGGEGVPWIGQQKFTSEKHVFANLGDGTYFHSGSLAIRAALAAEARITFKILFNDAVAMTGGQPVDGHLSVPQITRQVAAEGVHKIVVVTDEPDKYSPAANFAHGVTIHHRRELDQIQKDLREYDGVSVLIYDQTCAAEKRRRRKRKLMVDPPKRIFINDKVCEGCGDCSIKSNCLSVIPKETEFGRKRVIDQSSCNKDYSCIEGFCPSFVIVENAPLKKRARVNHAVDSALPAPQISELKKPLNIYITGVGGTGIITIGALIGMAAHLEKKGCAVIDQTGLAQKGGAVVSHVRLGESPEAIHSGKVGVGGADLILDCDMVVGAYPETLKTVKKGHTRVILNSYESITGAFTHNPDYDFKTKELVSKIEEAVGKENVDALPATKIATALIGDSIATNIFLIGYIYQKGFLPLSRAALEEAIRLNEVAIEDNMRAFNLGRQAAHNLQQVEEIARMQDPELLPEVALQDLEQIIQLRYDFLVGYQNKAYADRYLDFMTRVRDTEKKAVKDRTEFSKAVARYYFKLLAYKDEYEVARLYTSGEFKQKLKAQFDGKPKLTFYLAPPLFAKKDPNTGVPRKIKFGSWMFGVLKVLSHLKFLRQTPFDIFGFSSERKTERQLIKTYENDIKEILTHLTAEIYDLSTEIASIPEHIRGYGHIKERHLEKANTNRQILLERLKVSV